MTNATQTAASKEKTIPATLVRSLRLTPESSPEEVRELKFRVDDAAFSASSGQCIRVIAPGQFGNRHHVRLYSLADIERPSAERSEFTVCVRRCFNIDDFNGEQYAGVASNYLCNLPIGGTIEFAGPVGYPFAPPSDKRSNILMIGMGTGIAPFRGLARLVYSQVPRWEGMVRLFYGARSGLEMLYMNDENSDLANYFDQPTFKAFQAISPRPAFNAPVAIDRAITDNAAEVWEMLQDPATHVYLAGNESMLNTVENALAEIAGSRAKWSAIRKQLGADGRWLEMLY